MKKFLILIETIIFLILSTITTFAKTEIIDKPINNKINLIQMTELLHEQYSIIENKYIFNFNGNTLEIEKDNPLIKINDVLEPINTETKNNIILPKYETLSISENNIEIDYDKFIKISGYKTTDKGIEITIDDDYKIPEVKSIKNLDIDYINEHLFDLGYTLQDNIYKYIINNQVYQEITFSDKTINIKNYNGEEFEDNKTIPNLLIEELLKCIDQENYRDMYNLYIDGKNVDKTINNIKITIFISDSYSQLTLQLP